MLLLLRVRKSINCKSTGIYNVEASIDLTGVDIPYRFTAAQMVCAQDISFEVVEPSEMSIVEVFDERVIPACSGDGAQLVFEVVGSALNAGPYSLDIQNGALRIFSWWSK